MGNLRCEHRRFILWGVGFVKPRPPPGLQGVRYNRPSMTTSNASTQATILKELRQAYAARAAGKHGLARVCARRAAGWAIRDHLNTKGVDLKTPSAFEYIKHLQAAPGNPPNIQKVLEYLTQRVAKESLEEDSFWPFPEVDLVQEAHWLVEELLGQRLQVD